MRGEGNTRPPPPCDHGYLDFWVFDPESCLLPPVKGAQQVELGLAVHPPLRSGTLRLDSLALPPPVVAPPLLVSASNFLRVVGGLQFALYERALFRV